MEAQTLTIEGPLVVDGLGAVGMRAARELAGSPGPPVILRSQHADRVRTATEALGDRVRPWRAGDDGGRGVVVVARSGDDHVAAVRRHLAGGRHVVSVADEPQIVRELLDLADATPSSGCTLVVGAAFSPGLSCLLARHAASALDSVAEIRVAMVGAGGPACVRRRVEAAAHVAPVLRDGGWDTPNSTTELVWFPDPIGAADVGPGDLVEPLLIHRAMPAVPTIIAGLGHLQRSVPFDGVKARLSLVGRKPQPEPIGGIRVEAVGHVGDDEAMIVYAVVDRPAVAAGATAAVVALHLAATDPAPGVRSVGELGDPLPLLRELARRGVKAATFEPTV